jgi:hypothetical protein
MEAQLNIGVKKLGVRTNSLQGEVTFCSKPWFSKNKVITGNFLWLDVP